MFKVIFRENLVIKKSDGNVMLINLLTFRRKHLEAKYYNLFEKLIKKNFIDYTVNEKQFVKNLEEEKQILLPQETKEFEQNVDEYYKKLSFETNTISPTLILSYKCNSRCTYCIQNNTRLNKAFTMTKEHIDNIDKFYHKYTEFFNLQEEYEISITGGEPFLPENEPLLDYLFTKWADAKYNFATNGLTLSSFINILPLKNIGKLKVSLDGTEQIHNKRRPAPGIANPFQTVVQAVEMALKKDVPVELKVTIDEEIIYNLPELVDFFNSKDWLNNPLVKIGYSGVFIHDNGIKLDPQFNNSHNMVKKLIEVRNINPKIDKMKNNIFYGLQSLIYSLKRPINKRIKPSIYSCSVLTKPNYTFDPGGDIFLCTGLIGSADAKIGTYYPEISLDTNKITRLKERNSMKIEKCKSCAYRFICSGGCPASALFKNNDFMSAECSYYCDQYVIDNLGKMFL